MTIGYEQTVVNHHRGNLRKLLIYVGLDLVQALVIRACTEDPRKHHTYDRNKNAKPKAQRTYQPSFATFHPTPLTFLMALAPSFFLRL